MHFPTPMQEQKSPVEMEKDAIQGILAKAKQHFPEICEQVEQILAKLDVESEATAQEVYSILQQLRMRLGKVS